MKKLMSVIGVMAIVVSSTFAQSTKSESSAEKRPIEVKHKKSRHNFIADIPNLTEEQKKMMKTIKEEGKKQLEPMRQELKTIREKMAELKTADAPDEKQIHLLIDKSASIKAEMEKVRTAGELEFRSILTPEQRKVVDEKMKERRAKKEQKHMERKEMKHAK